MHVRCLLVCWCPCACMCRDVVVFNRSKTLEKLSISLKVGVGLWAKRFLRIELGRPRSIGGKREQIWLLQPGWGRLFLEVVPTPTYFSPCSVSFVLSGEYIQYSPLINFRLIIPSNIHLQLIIPSNIHLQCLCSTKNEKKTTSRRQFGIENYFYSESLTQPRNGEK
jgi:hypothetical protein